MSVIRAEKRRVLAVLLDPCGHVLKDILLRSGHTYIACGVGGCLEHELDSEILAGFLHDSAPESECLIAHMTGERDMHESLCAHFLSTERNRVASSDVVGVSRNIGGLSDNAGVFVGFARKEKYIVPLLSDSAEALSCSRNCLIDDDNLHQRVISKADDLAYRGFLL